MRGRGGTGRGSLQPRRGEVEGVEEAEGGEGRTELAKPSQFPPGTRLCQTVYLLLMW